MLKLVNIFSFFPILHYLYNGRLGANLLLCASCIYSLLSIPKSFALFTVIYRIIPLVILNVDPHSLLMKPSLFRRMERKQVLVPDLFYWMLSLQP